MSTRRHGQTLNRHPRNPKSTAAFGPRAYRAERQKPAPAPERAGLAALVDLYLAHLEDGALSARGRPYSPRTVQSYREALSRFLREAETIGIPDDVKQLSAHDVDRFGAALRAAGCTPKTVADWTAPVNIWLSWLVAKGALRANPLDGHRRPKPHSEPVQPFAAAELEQLLGACDTRTWLGTRDAAIVWTLLDTGVRASELCGLDLADVDQREWTLTIRAGKGGKHRTARLGLTARRAVGDFVIIERGAAAGPLFPSRTGERLRRNSLQQLVSRLGKAADVAGAHPHRFRHTFAIQFLRAGGDVMRLMVLLGHTSLDMTRRYLTALTTEDALTAHETASPADTLGLRVRERRR